MFLMFAIPMTIGAIVFSDSYLAILGEKEVDGKYAIGYGAAVPVFE